MRPRPLPRPGACPEGGVAAAPRAGPGRSPPPPSPPWPGAPRSPSACASGRSCRTATSASRYHRSRDTPEHGPRERSGRAGSAGVTGTGGGRCPAGAPHHLQRVPRAAGLWALASGVRVLSSRVPALGSEPCALGQSVSEQGRGARAVPGRGAREERGTPGLMPAVDVAWRAQISRFSCWERGAAVPGVARPDEVRRCRFTPYGSSQLSSGQPGAGQPRRDSGQQSRGVPESRHASARHLVPSAVPCHRRGWPGAPCQEGDSVSEVLPPALCNPQGAACRGRSGQGSAHTGSPKGKVGQPSPAAARVTRLQLHRSLSPSFPPGSGVKRMLLRTRRRCAQIWGKGGFEKPPLAP